MIRIDQLVGKYARYLDALNIKCAQIFLIGRVFMSFIQCVQCENHFIGGWNYKIVHTLFKIKILEQIYLWSCVLYSLSIRPNILCLSPWTIQWHWVLVYPAVLYDINSLACRNSYDIDTSYIVYYKYLVLDLYYMYIQFIGTQSVYVHVRARRM